VRKDLPVLMDALRATHPSVAFELEAAIGERAEVVQAMAQSIVGSVWPADDRSLAGAEAA
jgi:sirohydrochlorin cobaltochelatase